MIKATDMLYDWNREHQLTYRHLMRRGSESLARAWGYGLSTANMTPAWRDELAVCARMARLEIQKLNQR